MAQDRIRIQQPLRRMLMHTIAGIDDGNAQIAGKHVRSSGRWMPDNNTVSAKRLERLASVYQRLAFLNARGGCADYRGMRAQQLGGKFKGHAGTSGGFIEEKRNALASQERLRRAGLHSPRQFKKRSNFVC